MNSIIDTYCEQRAGWKNPLAMKVSDKDNNSEKKKKATITLDSGCELCKGPPVINLHSGHHSQSTWALDGTSFAVTSGASNNKDVFLCISYVS